MTDPLEALRTPIVPVDPDPAFAAALRQRITRALALPRGVAVSESLSPPTADPQPADPQPADPQPADPQPQPAGAITPYLAVADARRALEWYAEAFGARPRGEPIVMPDGRIGHAEIEIAGGVVMISDPHAEIGVVAPTPDAGVSVTLHATVADVDALAASAVRSGARLERPASDNPYGRIAVVRDPFGHRWMLNTPPAGGPPLGRSAREGDLAYVSLWVPDGEQAAAFFGDVLGWKYAGGAGATRQVLGATPPHGIFGGQLRSSLFLCLAVDDLDVARRRGRAAGGRDGDPRTEPYGRVVDCADDQGMPFALVEGTDDGSGPAGGGGSPGDLAYVTLEVADSARARAFYAAVVGWRFAPGRSVDGWNSENVGPMVGLHGGHAVVTAVPMYHVAHVEAAVARVRSAGGSATDPERHPYGVTADCVDDQGTRFYLGQL